MIGYTERQSGGPLREIQRAQRLAWANKQAKGFNTTDVGLEFCLLAREAAKAFTA